MYNEVIVMVHKLSMQGSENGWQIKRSNGIQANRQVVEELRGNERMCQALLEIMEPEINRIVEEATKQSKLEVEKSRLETEWLRKEAKEEAAQTAKKCWNPGSFLWKKHRSVFPGCQ